MKKYMKYEIKGTYKFVLGILAIILLASTFIQFNILNEMNSVSTVDTGFGITKFLLNLSPFIIFGAFLTLFFYIIGSFRKELYEDRGYLTFTLPLSGNQILGSKIIVALLWFMTIGACILLYNLLLSSILFNEDLKEIFKNISTIINSGMISVSITVLLSSIMTLILIYFSIAISKVSIKNKKVGNLWFIMFLIIVGLVNYFNFNMINALPYYINLTNFDIASINELSIMTHINGNMNPGIIIGNNYNAYINMASFLFRVVVCIAAFLSTGYLIEKKVDL